MSDLSAIPWNEFPLTANPDDRVSPHFKFVELTKSEIAARMIIPNGFRARNEAQAAVHLCRNVMEAVRTRFGAFTPNSVFRCQDLERALKKMPPDWTSPSQHCRGQACDIEVQDVPNMDLARWISTNLEFDQLILECFNEKEGANSGWVHVSLVPPGLGNNRREVRSYVMNSATQKYVYVPGLHATA